MARKESTEIKLARAEVRYRERDEKAAYLKWKAADERAKGLGAEHERALGLAQQAQAKLKALEQPASGGE